MRRQACFFRHYPASSSLILSIFGCGGTSGEQEAYRVLIFESSVQAESLSRKLTDCVVLCCVVFARESTGEGRQMCLLCALQSPRGWREGGRGPRGRWAGLCGTQPRQALRLRPNSQTGPLPSGMAVVGTALPTQGITQHSIGRVPFLAPCSGPF